MTYFLSNYVFNTKGGAQHFGYTSSCETTKVLQGVAKIVVGLVTAHRGTTDN